VEEEAPAGRRTLLEYDQQKNVSLTHAPNGAITKYEHDGQGRVVRMKSARGSIARFRYDVLGNLLSIESPSGTLQERAYDAHGNLLETRDATRSVRLRYGHLHKVVAREEAGTILRFSHDTEGRLTGVTNEVGETYTLKLDACGRIQQEIGFDGRTRVHQRDQLGRLEKIHRSSGRTSDFVYDAAGRILAARHSDGTFTEFTYRADGALERAKNGNSLVVFERDALGRIVNERQDDYVVSSRFDTSGERTLLETSLGGRMAVLRDALGEVEALHVGEESLRDSQPTLLFERDILGLEVARELSGGVRVEWQRDGAGRPTGRRTVRNKGGTSIEPLDLRTYRWRGGDQIEAMVDAKNGTTVYKHDARGRLIEQSTAGATLHRAMDDVGNVFRTLARTDRRYGPGGRLEQADGARYAYDEDGNQTEKIAADGRRWGYKWNGAGMLSEVERPDGLCVRFEYDELARRTRRTLARRLPDRQEAVEDDTRFVWDGHCLTHEVPAHASVTTWYFDPDSLAPVAKERDGSRWTIASDHLGTPTELYDELGQLAWQMQLDAFGTGHADVALQHCPWRWSGQYADEETGLYYNRFRYYDAQIGRYISQDPLGLAAGPELYGYPRDPLVATDPMGLSECGPSGPTVHTLDPSQVRFSQSNVRLDLPDKVASMRQHGWVGDPIDVVRMSDGGLTAVDNTRLAAAAMTGTPVQVIIREGAEAFPESRGPEYFRHSVTDALPQTWEEAVLNRISNQKRGWASRYPMGSPFTGVHPQMPGFSL
jgi:RHS repeat-associated protein